MDKKRRPYSVKARENIGTGMILSRLQKHVAGEVELSSTQIAAARILLAKVLPDLREIEHSGEIVSKHVTELTRDELMRIAARGSEGTAAAGTGEPEPSSVH